MKYVLVSVFEREINTEFFETLEAAHNQMEKEYSDCENVEDGEISVTAAWTNADGGDTNCDWLISQID